MHTKRDMLIIARYSALAAGHIVIFGLALIGCGELGSVGLLVAAVTGAWLYHRAVELGRAIEEEGRENAMWDYECRKADAEFKEMQEEGKP